jgi:hypothetical protein
MAETVHRVVVHETGGLHERVTDGRAHKTEAALLQVFRHGVGLARFGGNLRQALPRILDRFATHKRPDVRVEAAEFLLHRQECLRVVDGGLHLETVAHDAGSASSDFTLRAS